MESRLKERLTGAAILVALIVLIVPEIFHGRGGGPSAAVPGPAASAGAAPPTRSYTIELGSAPRAAAAGATGGPAAPVPAPAPASASASASASAAALPAAGAAATSPGGNPEPPGTPAAARPGTHGAQVETHAEAHAHAEVHAEPHPQPHAQAHAGPHAQPRDSAPDAPRAAAHGGWSVQLGLFAKAANAERLAHVAQSHGFAVQITRVGKRGLYRVAVAGIADRTAAERTGRRLRDAGLSAAILGPR